MLAIAGGKGGCGKTTTTIGLARAFAQRGDTPLVVDTDSAMPDVHHVAGIEREYGVDDIAAGESLATAVQYSARFPEVALLTGGLSEHLPQALRAAQHWDGPVLLDCPAGVSPDATIPLRAATGTLIVTTDEPYSMDDARRTMTMAQETGSEVLGLIVRRVADTEVDPPRSAPLLANLPSVATPYDEPQVEDAWQSLVSQYNSIRNFAI
jgi:septum site-determining protein MinD